MPESSCNDGCVVREWRLWAEILVHDFFELLTRVTVYSLIAWLTITAWMLAYQVFRWMFFTLIVTLTLQVAPGYAHDFEVSESPRSQRVLDGRLPLHRPAQHQKSV